ncbi:MAG: DUF4417 domain-containing protein [Oscillospiraceae bacterium]|nr:DUF4417 domain-containing protein [Oscillospiraceae bacterium]
MKGGFDAVGKSRKSKDVRQDKLFLRNEFDGEDMWGIPIIHPVVINDTSVELVSFTDAKLSDKKNCHKYVHCFQDDYKLMQAYANPDSKIRDLARYRGVLTPDYSLYPEMPRFRQLESIAKSRYCGAHWQHYGLNVIPTVNWSDENSFDFCFLGLQRGGAVAVSTVSCQRDDRAFMRGYNQMMMTLEPSTIICYGDRIPDMRGHIVCVDYLETTGRSKPWVDEEAMLVETLAS